MANLLGDVRAFLIPCVLDTGRSPGEVQPCVTRVNLVWAGAGSLVCLSALAWFTFAGSRAVVGVVLAGSSW